MGLARKLLNQSMKFDTDSGSDHLELVEGLLCQLQENSIEVEYTYTLRTGVEVIHEELSYKQFIRLVIDCKNLRSIFIADRGIKGMFMFYTTRRVNGKTVTARAQLINEIKKKGKAYFDEGFEAVWEEAWAEIEEEQRLKAIEEERLKKYGGAKSEFDQVMRRFDSRSQREKQEAALKEAAALKEEPPEIKFI